MLDIFLYHGFIKEEVEMEVKMARRKIYTEQESENQALQTVMSPEEKLQQIEKARENYKKKQTEGIAAAKLRGVKFGRPRKTIPVEFWKAKEDYINKKISSRDACMLCGISHSTFLRWVKENAENDSENTGCEKSLSSETGGKSSDEYIFRMIENIHKEMFSLKKEMIEMSKHIVKAENEIEAVLLKIRFFTIAIKTSS